MKQFSKKRTKLIHPHEGIGKCINALHARENVANLIDF
jgi:hypothetical protein